MNSRLFFSVLFMLVILAMTTSAQTANEFDTCYCYCCRGDATNSGLVKPCDENNLSVNNYPIANPAACSKAACNAAYPVVCPNPDRELGINRAGCATCQQGIDGKTGPGKATTSVDFNTVANGGSVSISAFNANMVEYLTLGATVLAILGLAL